jgi:N-acetylneuraminic acid mutarotase
VLGGYAPDGATVAAVEVYDPAADAWSAGPDLPLAVNHAMAATLGDRVYLAGGYTADGAPSPAVYRLDGGRWTAVAPLPEGRAAGGLVALDGRLNQVGGVAPGGLAQTTLVYDPAGDRWVAAPGLPTPREHLGAAAAAGRVVVVGGRVRGVGNLATAEAYDPASRRWTALAPLPTARGGLAATATAGGEVVAAGGEAAATFPQVEALDVQAGTWRSLPPLPTPRHGLGVVAVGATVYVLAGGPKPGLHTSSANEALDLG